MKLIGVWVAVMLLMAGCGTKKIVSDSHRENFSKEESSSEKLSSRAERLEQYGDSLSGRFPLPLQLPSGIGGMRFPMNFQASSSGIDLDFTFDGTGISYHATAKPTSKTTVSELTYESERESKLEATVKEESKEVEIERGFPWWIPLVLFLILAALFVVGKFLKITF